VKRVLGIDVASSSWAANGSALIEFDETTFGRVVAPAIKWPSEQLTSASLAAAIDAFARDSAIDAIALDGPQGWRDPDTAAGTPGVGRRCEYECRTQGKVGVYPLTYPRNQRLWIEFSIRLFDELLARPGVILAGDTPVHRSTDGYVVLECFPTSIWRTSGLKALPAKGKRPDLAPFCKALRDTYGLAALDPSSHDDLQAVVAALAAVGIAGGPVISVQRGSAAITISDAMGTRRLEGFIWDAKPRAIGGPVTNGASTNHEFEKD
jgi:hypothetical protein